MKRYKSIVLITALILSIAAVFCWQSAKKSRYDTVQETGENAGRTGETGTGTASASAIAETTGTGTGSPSKIAETTGTGTGSPSEIAETTGTGTGSHSGIIEETETDTEFPAGNPEEVAAVILHTNDVHVGLEENIGYDGLALYKKEIEALYDNVLLIDAGDAIQGAAIGAISKGNEIIKIMNRLGYDLAIPGNHEFDFGFDVLDDCSEQLDCGYTCANFCTIDGETVFERLASAFL